MLRKLFIACCLMLLACTSYGLAQQTISPSKNIVVVEGWQLGKSIYLKTGDILIVKFQVVEPFQMTIASTEHANILPMIRAPYVSCNPYRLCTQFFEFQAASVGDTRLMFTNRLGIIVVTYPVHVLN